MKLCKELVCCTPSKASIRTGWAAYLRLSDASMLAHPCITPTARRGDRAPAPHWPPAAVGCLATLAPRSAGAAKMPAAIDRTWSMPAWHLCCCGSVQLPSRAPVSVTRLLATARGALGAARFPSGAKLLGRGSALLGLEPPAAPLLLLSPHWLALLLPLPCWLAGRGGGARPRRSSACRASDAIPPSLLLAGVWLRPSLLGAAMLPPSDAGSGLCILCSWRWCWCLPNPIRWPSSCLGSSSLRRLCRTCCLPPAPPPPRCSWPSAPLPPPRGPGPGPAVGAPLPRRWQPAAAARRGDEGAEAAFLISSSS